jgi:uridine kinase
MLMRAANQDDETLDAMTVSVQQYADLAQLIRATAGPVRLVGVDGCGGAGKTTFAARLARFLDDAPVVHTDDFASYDEPTQWWPRFLSDVVEPLLRDSPASYHPYDWVARRPSDGVITIPPAPVVVIEGVGATRAAWRDRLVLRIWVDCPRDLRLRRGIARDGEEQRDFWLTWIKAEDAYVAAEHPADHADVVVDGAPLVEHDPESDYVVLSAPRAPG